MSDPPSDTLSAEEMDEKRLHRRAYDYLCRLLEVRNWLAECLSDDSIASVTDLEMNLRNGVVLARLGNSFAPEIIPIRNIFDVKQEKYEANENTPVYRHTDNIMQWRRAIESVRLPEIIIPETADVYEGRNTQTVFCLYALATLLYRLRKAPPLRNLTGKAEFTNSEMDEMKEQLKDRKVPEFGDISGILQNMTSSEKALASVNKAIEDENADELLIALQSADAGILYVESSMKIQYLKNLKLARSREENNSLNQATIQKEVIDTNNYSGLAELHHLLEAEGSIEGSTLIALFDLLQFEHTRESAVPLYISHLRKQKSSNLGQPLTKDQVKNAVDVANALAEVKIAVQQGCWEDSLRALSAEVLELKPRSENASLYHNRLFYNYDKSPKDFFLNRTDLQNILFEFDDISPDHRTVLELKAASELESDETFKILLQQISGEFYLEEHVDYYRRSIAANPPNSSEDVVNLVKHANELAKKAFSEADTMIRLNTAMANRDAAATRLHLMAITSAVKCPEFRTERIHWYVNALESAAARKFEENGPDAQVVWFQYEFSLGYVWIETVEHTRKTVRYQPVSKNFLSWSEIQDVIKQENASFNQHYAENEDKVRKSQAAIRKYMEHRRRKVDQLRIDQENLAARTIQEKYKEYRQRKDHCDLKSTTSPPLSLVRKFVNCLHEEENEITEQLEVEELKSRVWQLRVSNQQLDGNLRELDTKIGLLIKNRLNLQDVIAHKDRTLDETDRFAIRPASIRKKARDQQGLWEQLLYHLQADSKYLANLVQSDSRKDGDGLSMINDVIAPTFGFLTEKREQFLLVRLICEVLLRNVEKMDKLEQFRSAKDLQFVQDVMCSNMLDVLMNDPCSSIGDELKEFFVAEKTVDVFNLDPLDIYRSIYGRSLEDVQAAVDDPKVNRILESSKEFLAKWSEVFVRGIMSRYQLPPALLYSSCYLSDILRRQIPTSSNEDIQKTVAEYVFDVYLRHVMVSPRSIFRACGQEMKADEGAMKLDSVVQFIGYAIANRGYGNSKWFLTSLNKQIHTIYEEFRAFISDQLSEIRLDDVYGMNEFTQFDPSHKPSLSLLDRQLSTIIKYLKLNAPVLVSGTNSPLHDVLSKCSLPENQANRSILLHLHPIDNDVSGENANEQKFIRAKKYVVDLLLSGCQGHDIPRVLCYKASEENELLHNQRHNQEKMSSIKEKQDELQKILKELCDCGRITDHEHYQDLVTTIANDIRLATRRRKETAEQRHSLQETEVTLQNQREELRGRLHRYDEYLDTCLENLSRTSRRLSFRPDTKSAGKIQAERKSLDVIRTQTNTVEKMFKKGILTDIKVEGYDSPKKLNKLQLSISSTDKRGIFDVRVLNGKQAVNETSLNFQDLLQCESCEAERFSLDGGAVVFDVPRTIQYINKKFYSK